MNYKQYSERLKWLKQIIETGYEGTPEELGRKFNCSEKTIRNMINHLREDGFNVVYSRELKKYLHGNLVSV